MFSFLAWPRALAFSVFLLSLFSYSYAFEESIFTSSVTYCNPPETLLIQRFELAYFPANNSITFNVSAASVQANVNVTANLFVNVYGMNPVNVTLDLCGIFGGALCPLPMYNFTGADSISLPAAFDVAKSVPGIAYQIPDLEGFAQLSLTEIHTGAVKACVQLTLANGRSAHQTAVEWTTGGVALAVLVIALWQSTLFPQGILPFRLLELMTLYQTIASSSFLNLNYPSVYRAFALNFSWAMGLISSSSFQNSINRMRHLTGGSLADAIGGSAVGLVNRKLSPYNSPNSDIVSQITSYGSILSRSLPANLVAALHPNLAKSLSASSRQTIVNGQVQTVTAVSSNVLQAGVPIYVNTLHIATANAFMTVFLCMLCVLGVASAVFVFGYGLLQVTKFMQFRKYHAGMVRSFDYRSFVLSWCIRIALVVFFPLMIFVIYQWTLKDSWLSILISVISFVVISATILYPIFLVVRTARRRSPFALYTYKSEQLARSGPLYAQHSPERFYFSCLLLVAFFFRALFISVAKASGDAQIALMIIVEFFLVLAHLVLKPAMTRGGDVFGSYLAICRLACTALMIAFIEKLQVKAIPRVVIGIVIALTWSVAVVVVIGNIAWNGVIAFKIRRNTRSESPSTLESPVGSEGSMLEKGIRRTPNGSTKSELMEKDTKQTGGSTDSFRFVTGGMEAEDIEEVARGRPINPTPENNIPFDQYNYAPYPISPTGTTVSTMDPPSLYSRDSGTLTVGSLLPRRWSFSLSQPGSPSASSCYHRSSLTPSPMPPSSPSEAGGNNGAVSRNTSVRRQQHQPKHEDIQEEETIEPLSSSVVSTPSQSSSQSSLSSS
ncbi:TRP-domain-containing protein [Pholiota conissans]|uniref:TRP-domain-containing protein n=1 Tax=Pholiota conissans TaxID=109636 RepID=A0A9P6D694_9AGAR|nr:TRP-domain-containing protein [Pholiota conissans]